MRNVLIGLISFCILSSCYKQDSKEVHSIVMDTLYIHGLNLPDNIEKDLSKFNLKFGIAIPKYYLVKDSLAIDLNEDALMDTLILLSPILLEDSKYSDYLTAGAPGRILVEVINLGRSSKVRNVYKNLTSNIGGVLSKYSGISRTKDGFEIRHESGNRYSWSYTSNFSIHNHDSIYLIRLQKICSLNGLDEKREYFFERKSVQQINIADTIKNNCNCDKLWMDLEKIQGSKNE